MADEMKTTQVLSVLLVVEEETERQIKTLRIAQRQAQCLFMTSAVSENDLTRCCVVGSAETIVRATDVPDGSLLAIGASQA